jgi:hypothetical protein
MGLAGNFSFRKPSMAAMLGLDAWLGQFLLKIAKCAAFCKTGGGKPDGFAAVSPLL